MIIANIWKNKKCSKPRTRTEFWGMNNFGHWSPQPSSTNHHEELFMSSYPWSNRNGLTQRRWRWTIRQGRMLGISLWETTCLPGKQAWNGRQKKKTYWMLNLLRMYQTVETAYVPLPELLSYWDYPLWHLWGHNTKWNWWEHIWRTIVDWDSTWQ